MGFDFIVEYQPGPQNRVADALSRQHESGDTEEGGVVGELTQGELRAVSKPIPLWLDSIKEENQSVPVLQEIIQRVQKGIAVGPWSYSDGVLYFKKWIFLWEKSELIPAIFGEIHQGCHEGSTKPSNE